METCVRGFCYMPENMSEVNMDLQYIEGGELERTWKASRRQRLKEQEQKIWEEFVKEQDIVQNAYSGNEDPYQFLHQLPEICLKELMEAELQRMKKENEEVVIVEHPNQGEGDQPSNDKQVLHSVTFAEEDKAEMDMFHIFDDDNDFSGPDEDGDCSPSSPGTVRERPSSASAKGSIYPAKSTENVTNLIENSIYCAKVKDLRLKLNDEIIAIIGSLQHADLASLPAEEVRRRCKRSAQFTARFTRVYMYQLQRQVSDMKRACERCPVPLHTQFQAHMLRAVSLHHNLLNAAQTFHKSVPQTSCVRESCGALRGLLRAARAAGDVTRAGGGLPGGCHDELLDSCDRLDETINEYSCRVAEFMSSTNIFPSENNSTSQSASKSNSRQKLKKKGRLSQPSSKSESKSWSTKDTDARLSMYSLDTLRINLHGKGSKHNSAAGKPRVAPSGGGAALGKPNDRGTSPRAHNLSPRSRRPLMRAPCGASRRARAPCEGEVATLVETVGTCPSSHRSRAPSPRSRARTPPHSPRNQHLHKPTFGYKARSPSPKNRSPQARKPRPPGKPSNTLRSETRDTITTNRTPIAPITKIQCAKKTPQKDIDKNEFYDADDLARNSPVSVSKEPYDKGISAKDGWCDVTGNTQQRGHIGNPGKEDSYTGKECCSSSGILTEFTIGTECSQSTLKNEGDKSERERDRDRSLAPAQHVTRLLRRLCSADPTGMNERASGAKNAQLLCVQGSSPRQPSTPQLLRILEETIQKKTPRPMYKKPKDPDRLRLNFNIPENIANRMFQYRTKFVQHMLTSPMYANSTVGKPWEMIGSISEKIIDELLTNFASEMEIKDVIQELYKCETN